MISKINFRIIVLVITLLLVQFSNAQIKKGEMVDGIMAVIGSEIILQSDIDEQMNYAKQQGTEVTNKCDFMGNLITNKLLIYQAKNDTLIENRSSAIKEMVDNKYSQILSQFPDEKAMLQAYKFRTGFEMKSAIEKIDTDNYYGQQKYGRITEKTDITPNEVTDFFNTYSSQLPMVKDEVSVAQIIMFPKLSEAHKDELISKLKGIKESILKKEQTFDQMAMIYSEDEGSSKNGGLYTNISKGKMVKVFEATALNLQDGEISNPVESEFGYHLIQLVKKTGKKYDARHILLKSTPNAEEIAAATTELNAIRKQILDGKLTFKEAAYKYSDDKQTKFNAGVISGGDGSDKIDKQNLPPTISYQIAGLKKSDITEVFQDEKNDKKDVAILKVLDEIPEHKLELATDYERIKNMALEKKKGKIVERWVKEKLPDTFISINKLFQDCSFNKDLKK